MQHCVKKRGSLPRASYAQSSAPAACKKQRQRSNMISGKRFWQFCKCNTFGYFFGHSSSFFLLFARYAYPRSETIPHLRGSQSCALVMASTSDESFQKFMHMRHVCHSSSANNQFFHWRTRLAWCRNKSVKFDTLNVVPRGELCLTHHNKNL